jgi:hypothetical protein
MFRTVLDKKKTSCDEVVNQLYAIYKVSAQLFLVMCLTYVY